MQEGVKQTIEEPRLLGLEVVPKDAALWDEFIDDMQPSHDDMLQLLLDPRVKKETILQRAAVALTAPCDRESILPYKVPDDLGERKLLNLDEGEGAQSLRQSLRLAPDRADLLARGVIFWRNQLGSGIHEESNSELFDNYQRIILELLPHVDEHTADELFFDHLTLVTPHPRPGRGHYSFARDFVQDTAIPTKYRVKVFDDWAAIAREEKLGRFDPQDPPAPGAFKELCQLAEEWGSLDQHQIDRELFVQTIIALENSVSADETYIRPGRLSRISEQISIAGLRLQVLQRHLRNNEGLSDNTFIINDENDLLIVGWVAANIDKHPLDEPERKQLSDRVEKLVDEYKARKAMEQHWADKEADIYDRLRS